MRKTYDLKGAIDALTQPRLVHHAQPDADGVLRLITVEHPALIDLLEHGTGTARSPRGGAGGGDTPIPVDANALEQWAIIRDQVRDALRRLRAPWVDDLKTDLRTWHAHHELAVARARVDAAAVEFIERTVEAWRTRIEEKYDPDERREWTEPCPAMRPAGAWGEMSGHTERCGARRIVIDGQLQFAVALNITKRKAECRSCGHVWEGDRQLMQLRYESNLYEAERLLEAAAAAEPAAPERRELALTGPIDLP